MDLAHSASGEHDRALHPGRSSADDEDPAVGIQGWFDVLRVPPAPVLLAGGGVLRAGNVIHRADAGDADVAADALADLCGSSVLDLLGQERIRDCRPCPADQVADAAPDELGHPVRIGQALHEHHRLFGHAPHLARPVELVARRSDSSRAHVEPRPGDHARVDVPQVDEIVGQPNELERLVRRHACRARGIDSDPGGDCAPVPERLADELQRLEPEPCPVGEGAAVAVLAIVVEGGQELRRQVAMCAVHIDDVEAGLLGPHRRRHIHPLHSPDVVAAQLPGIGHRIGVRRDLARCPRW